MTAASMPSDLSPQGCQISELSIPDLVARVYESAPAAERGRLIEQLLRPLGVLSLVAIADGIFAKLRFRSGWQNLSVRLDDLTSVRASHVVALADHAQQVSVETVDSLAQWITASPVMSGSAAAGLLVSLLVQRARRRRGDSGDASPWPTPADGESSPHRLLQLSPTPGPIDTWTSAAP